MNPDFYMKKFDKILLISPSGIPNLKLSEEYWSKNLDLSWIYDKINEYLKINKST